MNTVRPTLSLGRMRGLQASATPRGLFTILAIDHRDSLRAMIRPSAPEAIPAAEVTAVKLAIVQHVAPGASAVLLDPIYGAAQAIAAGALPGQVGLLCALEEQGYLGDPLGRQTTLMAGWSVAQARRLGATGIKLLLFYHPEAGPAAEAQERLVRAVLADCHAHDLPLFLEPISYALDPQFAKGTPEFARQRRRIVIESARQLGALGPDVLKVEFPVEARFEPDQAMWREACAELNAAVVVPWVVLSADETFETFKRQLRVACEAGASGFIAGRSIWREAAPLTGAARAAFLMTTARQRFRELVDIAQTYGQPWTERASVIAVDERGHSKHQPIENTGTGVVVPETVAAAEYLRAERWRPRC